MSANLHFDLFTINGQGLGLKVRLPYFLGMSLRKADVIAVLLAFTG